MEHKYYPEVYQAIDSVEAMDEAALLFQLDTLFGRDKLPAGYSLEQLRAEAIRQTRIEFLNAAHPSYRLHFELLNK